MQTTTILYIIIALLLSLSVAFFQYFYKAKSKAKINSLLFSLKALALFLVLLLFINPKIKTTKLENSKPTLSVLVDDSKSISFFKEENNIEGFVNKLKENGTLRDKFNLEFCFFNSDLRISDSVSFSGNETNIYKALSEVDKLNKNKNAPIILLTDGNQTIGNDYEFINSKQTVYPIVFGDTTKYQDLKISQVNVNKYSYIKNKFPVEVILNYDGNESVQTKFSIFSRGSTVFSKSVQFSKDENSKIITTNLTSAKEGINYYTAALQKIKNEKNTRNNTKNFSVEVIDEQTKIAILTSVLHPDIGLFKKAIESNKQRSVEVFMIDKFKNEFNDYQLVILYQPNNQFNAIFSKIKQENANFLLVSGANSDWNFLNKQQLGFSKKALNQTENYGAIYNPSFLTFLQKDIGFNEFSPLLDQFGEVTFSKDHQDLLFQSINGVQTQQPLLSVLEQNNQKTAVIFGEGIWKWRAASYLNSNSFQDFDQFLGNLVQYLSSTKKRNRLEVNADNLYPANSIIRISAFYTDKNYQFDARASLEITVTNKETKEITKLPFSLINNSYQIAIENLISGEYDFKVAVLGQNITKYGSFKITDYEIEEQFTHANVNKLKKLALKTGGKLYHKNQTESLMQDLINNTSYYTTQKPIVKEQNLIDWKWILFFVIGLFTTEWFIRKYYGKI
ncbi:VWA domain-containing protein [uncultured Polaribacter sp.]|uniref:VWA domain-containing protein n=1 Tax=uncultured Polaribacter sp. TaxID=174711 RepID=UPI00261C1877|nr:VWA domain-containing protein [uncultured Polaribacter sp.]